MHTEDFRCILCGYTETYDVEDHIDWSEITRAQAQQRYHLNCRSCGAFMYPVSMHTSEQTPHKREFLLFAGCKNAFSCNNYQPDCEKQQLKIDCLTDLHWKLDHMHILLEKTVKLLSDLHNDRGSKCS